MGAFTTVDGKRDPVPSDGRHRRGRERFLFHRSPFSRMSRLVGSPPPNAAEKPIVSGRGTMPRRVLSALVALLIGAAGVGLAVVAFRTGQRTRPATTPVIGKIAFATSILGRWQIVAVNADGTSMTPLTDLPTDQFHPAWSPDGTRIAFDVQGEAGMQIGLIEADGSNLQMLTEGPGWNYLQPGPPTEIRSHSSALVTGTTRST